MKKKNNNVIVIVLLVIIFIIWLILGILFATNVISFNNKNNLDITNNISTNEKDTNENYIILSKLVDNIEYGETNVTFNNINVLINQNLENNVCQASKVVVNENELLSEIDFMCVNSYEIYDNKVIFLVSDTGNSGLYIYDTDSESIVFDSTKNSLKNYRIKSFLTTNNIILIKSTGCGAQCGVDNDGDDVNFEVTYQNGLFSEPVMTSE